MIEKSLLIEVADMAKLHAYNLREMAGYAGEMHDRGARALDDTANAFISGLNGELPKDWEPYLEDAIKARKDEQNRNDPEWDEYQRLCGKFED